MSGVEGGELLRGHIVEDRDTVQDEAVNDQVITGPGGGQDGLVDFVADTARQQSAASPPRTGRSARR